MHEYMPPAPATPIMIVGASSDVVGDAELTGFFDIATHMLHMSKRYVRTNHPRPLNWIYRGRLFAFGFAGRWSTKGLVETQVRSSSCPSVRTRPSFFKAIDNETRDCSTR
jgi:hypothetical protein